MCHRALRKVGTERTGSISLPGFLLALFVSCFVAVAAWAGERVNTDDSNVAILGYDTVAYFTIGEPTPGMPDFDHVWHGARWQFANARHRDLFAANPARYAPRYGGFCAGAMALGRLATVDPEAWVIIDDKLYLNYAQRSVQEFAENAEDRIPSADANWQHLGQTGSE